LCKGYETFRSKSYEKNFVTFGIIDYKNYFFLQSVDGKGFRKLISETLAIGSAHGLLHVDNLIPDPKTIKTHVGTIAADNRKKLKEQLQSVRRFLY
jgi:hypothetical protein